MKLIDMKLPKKNKKELKEACEPCTMDEEKYPYGLQIHFETEQLKDLPYLKDKKVGDKCYLFCEATVTNTRISERQEGKERHSVGLQIEKVEVKDTMKKYSKEMSPKEYKEYRGIGGGK
jgi:hypothetical protein